MSGVLFHFFLRLRQRCTAISILGITNARSRPQSPSNHIFQCCSLSVTLAIRRSEMSDLKRSTLHNALNMSHMYVPTYFTSKWQISQGFNKKSNFTEMSRMAISHSIKILRRINRCVFTQKYANLKQPKHSPNENLRIASFQQ